MKANKMNEMSAQQLLEREKELKSELFNLRFQQATGELNNPMRIKECKKDIARIKTVVRQREIQAASN